MYASSYSQTSPFANLSTAPSSLCLRCATTHRQSLARAYSSTAGAAVATAQDPVVYVPRTPVVRTPTARPAPAPSTDFDLRCGMILTRAPLVTRDLSPFENAFFFYQKRLEERLNAPFITDVFFKPDTARKLDWDIKIAEREGTPNKEIGSYKGKTSKAWDDELRVGDEMSSPDHLTKSLLKDAEARVSDDAEVIPVEDVVPVERPVARVTEADAEGDTTRLDRALDRTLYLVVKDEQGWNFPADQLQNENLLEVRRTQRHTMHRVLILAGQQEGHEPVRRRQHEHLGHRPRARRPRRQAARVRRGRHGAAQGPQDVFPKGAHPRGSGGPQGQPVWVHRVSVADARGAAEDAEAGRVSQREEYDDG